MTLRAQMKSQVSHEKFRSCVLRIDLLVYMLLFVEMFDLMTFSLIKDMGNEEVPLDFHTLFDARAHHSH